MLLRVFEKRTLRETFGPKSGKITAEWRELHIEELNDLYCSPNIIRVIQKEEKGDGWGMWENPEGKRSLGKPRRKREDNIKMDFKKLDGEAWVELLRIRIGTRGGRL